MRKVLLILGQGGSSYKTADIVAKNYPELLPVHCSYAPMGKTIKKTGRVFLRLTDGNEAEQILEKYDRSEIAGVVNRYDSYIPLHGKLVDDLGLSGPGLSALEHFRYKASTDKLMRNSQLGEYRPRAEVVPLAELDKVIQLFKFPYVIKPTVGAKSRGVFVIRNDGDVVKALERIGEHYSKIKIARMLKSPEVLVEDYIDGKQIAPVSFVDANGELHILAGVDVTRGPDVGQKHIQNVYRTTPSAMSEGELVQVRWLLQRLVDLSGLKSTFLDPELYWVGEKLYIIEINCRLGGFRNTLLQEAYGIDVDSGVIDLALGRDLDLKFKSKFGCTACEIWEDEGGEIEEFSLPEGYEYIELKKLYGVGDEYVAPPKKDKPLAAFYLKDEIGSSFKQALEMRKKVRVKFR